MQRTSRALNSERCSTGVEGLDDILAGGLPRDCFYLIQGDPPAASRGHDDLGMPQEKWTSESGWVDLWAPPRGYAVYVPQ